MKIKRIIATILSTLVFCSMLAFTADAVATQGNPRIWVFQNGTGFGATDPQNSALKNQYDAENDIIFTRVIPNNYTVAVTPYLAQWNVKCVFNGTDPWSLTVACLMRPNVAGITPVICSAQSRKDTAGTVAYNGEEKYTPATDADGNEIVFGEDDIGKWHTVYFRHDGLEMRYYNQYQILPYGLIGKASDYYTADNSKTVDIAVLAEFATDAEAFAADLASRAKAPKIKLTFNKGNGEEATTAEVVTGAYLPAKVDFPEITAPEGKTFLGWATDANAAEGVLEADVPTANTTYYAIYEDISYNIIFKNGDDETIVNVKHGETPDAPEFKKTGYTLGWDNIIVAATAGVTYNAVWTANEYDVVFDAGEGAFSDGEKTKTVKATFDAEIAAPEENPTLDGYNFIGWTPEVGTLTTEGATFTAAYALDVPEEVTTAVKIKFAREGAPKSGNFAKLYIYKDNTKTELVTVYDLEDENTTESEITVEIELAEGTYYAEIVKNGYLTYKTELTLNADSLIIPDITLIPGDIKGSYDDVCGDGLIDIDDFIRVLRGFAQDSVDELRNAVDINEDGDINVTDIGYIKTNLGKKS